MGRSTRKMHRIALIALFSVSCVSFVTALGSARQSAPTSQSAIITPAGAPTIDQSLEMRSASAPRISPDGRWVVYEVSRTNWEDNAFERELWLADTTSNQRTRLSSSKRSSYDAQWSPDGKWIAFISDRPPILSGVKKDDKAQIYLISASGGEARELTRVETGVTEFAWAPNGRTHCIHVYRPGFESAQRSRRKIWRGASHRERLFDDASLAAGCSRSRCGRAGRSAPPHRRRQIHCRRIFVVARQHAHCVFGAARSRSRFSRYCGYLCRHARRSCGEKNRQHAGTRWFAGVVAGWK